MSTYARIFSSITQSTLWELPATTSKVFLTMFSTCDRDGVWEGSFPGLVRLSNVTREECKAALDTLSSPDPESTTPDFDGRRIQKIDGGWLVLNYDKYNGPGGKKSSEEEAAKKSERNARYYARKKALNIIPDSVDNTIQSRLKTRSADQAPSRSGSGSYLSSSSLTDAEENQNQPVGKKPTSEPDKKQSQPTSQSEYPAFNKNLGPTFFGGWPGADDPQYNESANKAVAAFENNITSDNYQDFCTAYDVVLGQFNKSTQKDRRKVLGSFRTFCEERWKNIKPPAAPPIPGPVPVLEDSTKFTIFEEASIPTIEVV